jgi:hypothetical protein
VDIKTFPRHPKGSAARVLLSSVFGPYAQDDAYGSRRINPMELYHNQVTRVQGGYSLRMFHRSWGLMMIQANLQAPVTLLEFPTLERFEEELRRVPYDVVGISAIVPNVGKVKKMCELVRRHQPQATIVVGGHVANLAGLAERVDADHVVRGEGVRWFRAFLGEPTDAPVRHPLIMSAFGARTMGMPFGQGKQETAATVIPSVGCPLGCNFCSTSAMFGGKGRFVSFYEDGDALFEVMRGIEARLGVRAFFVMDENFLLHRKRALRLLERMQEHGKAWALYVFSSANALRLYTDEQLVQLGISWVWLGLEEHPRFYDAIDPLLHSEFGCEGAACEETLREIFGGEPPIPGKRHRHHGIFRGLRIQRAAAHLVFHSDAALRIRQECQGVVVVSPVKRADHFAGSHVPYLSSAGMAFRQGVLARLPELGRLCVRDPALERPFDLACPPVPQAGSAVIAAGQDARGANRD